MNFLRIILVCFSVSGVGILQIVTCLRKAYNCRWHGTNKLVEPWFWLNHKGIVIGFPFSLNFKVSLLSCFPLRRKLVC